MTAFGSAPSPAVSFRLNPELAGSRWPAAASWPAMFVLACENRMDRKIAVPSEPPTCRKNVVDEVATPMSRGVDGVLHGQHDRLHVQAEAGAEDDHVEVGLPQRGVGADAGQQQQPDDEQRPTRSIGKILYRPVREVS